MTTIWYVVPLDGGTNEALARELAQAGLVTESETEITITELKKEKRVRAWQIPHQFVTLLARSAGQHGFKYAVYVREGNGMARKWNLQRRGKLRRSKKYRAARGALPRA